MPSCAVQVIKRTKAAAIKALMRSVRVPGFFTHPPARHADRREIESLKPELRVRMSNLIFCRSIVVYRQIGTSGQFVVAFIYGALWSAAGERNPKNGSSVRSALQQNLATVVLHDLLYDCKSKPGAVLFAEAYKGMKQFVANRFCNARTVVRDRNRDSITHALDRDQNSALAAGRCFTGIQQKIV